MDNSLFRWINRLASRTGWAHGFFTNYAKYGIVLFAALLVAAYLDGRHQDDLRAVAGSVWAAGNWSHLASDNSSAVPSTAPAPTKP